MSYVPLILMVGVVGLLISLCILVVRLLKGPTSPDRLLAGDTMTSMAAAMMVLLGVYYEAAILLDTALLIAFLSFIGTIAISKYLEGRGLAD